MPHTAPVQDWATDFDVLDPRYVTDPFSIWDELRQSCPIAHTDRRKSSWLPTRYDDVTAIAHDIAHFSSLKVAVIPGDEDEDPNANFDGPNLEYGLPPDFSGPAVAHLDAAAPAALVLAQAGRQLRAADPRALPRAARPVRRRGPRRCRRRLRAADPGPGHRPDPRRVHGPVRHLHRLGARRAGVRRRCRAAPAGAEGLLNYFLGQLEEARRNPGDDLLSELLTTEVDGQPVDDGIVLGMAALVLIAGVDTTWSAIGSSLWHLAAHPDDRKRLAAEPELMPTAVEELLRAYAPVTMAREVTEDIEYKGCPMKAGDKVLMNFPAANRDPEAFEQPDVVQTRPGAQPPRGLRLGDPPLCRIEPRPDGVQVALEEWMARIPEFSLAEGEEITWAGGQVRGPRILPVVFP